MDDGWGSRARKEWKEFSFVGRGSWELWRVANFLNLDIVDVGSDE